MTTTRLTHALLASLAGTSLAAPANAEVRARDLRVGLGGGGMPAVRMAEWTGIEVALTHIGENVLEADLRVEQFDRDLDVVVSSTRVNLIPNQPRTYRVYFVGSSLREGDAVRVSLADTRGGLVPLVDENRPQSAPDLFLYSRPVTIIPPMQTVIVDVAPDQTAPRLVVSQFFAESDINELAYRAPHFLHVEYDRLPDRWQGLAAYDILLLDDPDASAVPVESLKAVEQWVRQGGRLVLAVGRNWTTVVNSPLATLLPVRISGTTELRRGDAWQRIVRQADEWADLKAAEVNITCCEATPRGGVTEGIYPIGAAVAAPLVYRRQYGRGTATFVGAPLRELLALRRAAPRAATDDEDGSPSDSAAARSSLGRTRARALFQALTALPDPGRSRETGWYMESDPYKTAVTREITFQQRAGLYVLFSLFFAVGYLAVATVGTFKWLERRKWTHHAWSAFVVTAAAATLLGVAAVWALRGVTWKLQEVQVVDAWANVPVAQATAIYGVRAPIHTQASLRLPSAGYSDDPANDFGPLCALPPSLRGDSIVRGYVAPATYQMARAGLRLEDVSIRATLKEFMGYWQGALGGQLEARLVAHEEPRTRVSQFVAPSVIRNNLGVDLRACILLDTQDDFARRALAVRCFFVDHLPNGAEFRGFANWYEEKQRKTTDETGLNEVDGGPAMLSAAQLPNLERAIRSWGDGLRWTITAGEERVAGAEQLRGADNALLLLSAFGLYDPRAHAEGSLPEFNPTGGRRYELLHQLSRHTAILIGFSDAPGPAVLEVDGDPLRSSRSLTMYRFLIPVEGR
ncbi:MAG: hypothetical protein L6R00_04620 [Phycisphaerae bacterium]|nr:hypothetical protein [Phycisphaerae bacterium]